MDENLKTLNECWASITTKMYENSNNSGNENDETVDVNDVEFEEVK